MFVNSSFSLLYSCLFSRSSLSRRVYQPKAVWQVSKGADGPKVKGTSSFSSLKCDESSKDENASGDSPAPHLFQATSGSTFYFPLDRHQHKSSTPLKQQRQPLENSKSDKEDEKNEVWIRCPARSFRVNVSTPPLTAEEIENWKLDRLILVKALPFDVDRSPAKFLVPPQEMIFSMGPQMDKVDELYRRKGRYTPSEVAHVFFPIVPSYYVELRHVFQALPPSIAYRMEQDCGSRGMGANFFAGYPMLFHQRRPSHQKSAVKLNPDFWFVRAHPFFKKADRFQYKHNSDYKAHIGGVVHKNAPDGHGLTPSGGEKDIELCIFDILARHIGWQVIQKLSVEVGAGKEESTPAGGSDHVIDSFVTSSPALPGDRTEKDGIARGTLSSHNTVSCRTTSSSKEWIYHPVPLIPWMNSLSKQDMAVVQQVPEKRVLFILSKYLRVFQLMCAHGEDPLLYTDRQNLAHLFPTPKTSSAEVDDNGKKIDCTSSSSSALTTAVPLSSSSSHYHVRLQGERCTQQTEEEDCPELDRIRRDDRSVEEEQAKEGDASKIYPTSSGIASLESKRSEQHYMPTSAASSSASSTSLASTPLENTASEMDPNLTPASSSSMDTTSAGGSEGSIPTSHCPSSSSKGNFSLDEDLLGLDELLSGPESRNSNAIQSPSVEDIVEIGKNEEEVEEAEEEMSSIEEEEEDEENKKKPMSMSSGEENTTSASSSLLCDTPTGENESDGITTSGVASAAFPTRLDIILVRRLPPHVAPRSLSNFNASTTPLPAITSLVASFLSPPPSLRDQLDNFFSVSMLKHRHKSKPFSMHSVNIWRWMPVQYIYEALSKEQKKALRLYRGLTNYLRLHGELFEVSADLMHVIAHDPKGVISPFLPNQKTFIFEERVVLPAESATTAVGKADEGKEASVVDGSAVAGGGGACMIGEKERQLFKDILGDSQIPTTRKQIALLDPENPILNSDVLYEEISRLLPRQPMRKREVLSKLPPILRAALPTRTIFLHNCSPHIAVFYEKGETMIQRKEDFNACASSSSHRLLPGEETLLSAEEAVEELRQSVPEGGATIKALRILYLSSDVVNALMQHYGSIIRALDAFPQYFCVERREGVPASNCLVKLR